MLPCTVIGPSEVKRPYPCVSVLPWFLLSLSPSLPHNCTMAGNWGSAITCAYRPQHRSIMRERTVTKSMPKLDQFLINRVHSQHVSPFCWGSVLRDRLYAGAVERAAQGPVRGRRREFGPCPGAAIHVMRHGNGRCWQMVDPTATPLVSTLILNYSRHARAEGTETASSSINYCVSATKRERKPCRPSLNSWGAEPRAT